MTVSYETDHAVLVFEISDVKDHLEKILPKNHFKKWIRKLDAIPSSQNVVLHGNKYKDLGFIALDLLETGKGSVTCKLCNTTYRPDQLKPIVVGHGRSPFDLKSKLKGGVLKRLFGKKRNPPGFGGKGYECPIGHELISMTTWIT